MHHPYRTLSLVITGLLLALSAGLARGQTNAPFEYDPYRVRLWIAVEPVPQLGLVESRDFARQLARRADSAFGATWQVLSEVAPPSISRRASLHPEQLTADDLFAADAKLADDDKCMLVALNATQEGYQLVARELDCRSRSWGEPVTQTFAQLDQATEIATHAICLAFAPVVRIEIVDGDKAVTRLRAGGLIVGDDSPAAIEAGALLQPVLRRNDRYGKAAGGAIQRLPFTYLQVTARQGYRVECDIHSGVRGAIGGRGARTEKLALLVRPQARGTRLVLMSKAKPPAPLVDYQILTRLPVSKNDPTPLGFSDSSGGIDIPLGKSPLQLVYVRHGQQMLARIPIVPGLVPRQTLSLTDDDPRLAAEGYFVSMQNNVMDVVARRELLAARIRARLEKRDFEKAQQMLQELRALTGRADLLRQVEQQQSRFAAGDKAVQNKVDKMFAELRKLLAKHLDPKLVDQVAAEINAAKKAS